MAGGDYGRIRHTFWTDPDIKRNLSIEQKALLIYYFTSPHSSLVGLYYCPFGYVAVETGIPEAQVREWTHGALARYVTYDEATEEVFVHRAGRHQVGDELKPGDKRVKAIQKAVSETHSLRLVAKFLKMYPGWPLDMEVPDVPDEPERKPLDKPLRSQSSSSAVAVQSNSIPDAPRTAAGGPTTGSAEALALKVAIEAYADENNYGPRDRLIAIGEDITAWRTPNGTLVPADDRLRILKLADAHMADGGKAHDRRSALKYVIAQQYDPFAVRQSNAPHADSEAAKVGADRRRETPGRSRTAGRASTDETPTNYVPTPDEAKEAAARREAREAQERAEQDEMIRQWEAAHELDARRVRKEAAESIEANKFVPAHLREGATEAEYRRRALEAINGKEAAA